MAFRRHAQADSTVAPSAFWKGCYADLLIQRGDHVPSWAWINALAHGNALLVASLATATPLPNQLPEDMRPWFRARKAMALAIMDLVSREGVRLNELQQQVLIGIELELAATAGHYERGPIETACLVVDGLEAYCRQR